MKALIGVLFILSIVFLALEDSIYDNGKKALSKLFKLVAVACLLAVTFLFKNFSMEYHLQMILAYPFFWFFFYDITYNIFRTPPLSWNYAGTTSGWYSKFRKSIAPIYPFVLFISLLLAFFLFFYQ